MNERDTMPLWVKKSIAFIAIAGLLGYVAWDANSAANGYRDDFCDRNPIGTYCD